MIVIVSPTKTQKRVSQARVTSALFSNQTHVILSQLQDFDCESLISRYKVSEKIAQSLKDDLANYQPTSPALYTYQGSTFTNMNRHDWDRDTLAYARSHLLILSALYGALRPMDGISLYRLDFHTDLSINLYETWKHTITTYLNTLNTPIVSLASEEYEKMIDQPTLLAPFIKISFKERVAGRLVIKGTYAKIARGKMVHHLMQNRCNKISDIQSISFDGYTFAPEHSTPTHLTFIR